jgi:hypothetical protein
MPSQAPDCDLHPHFRDPDRARAILDACIADNRSKGVLLVRVVHGKGKGDFRELIHSHLGKHPYVDGFTLCDPLHGGSGATWVHISEDPDHPAQKKPSVRQPHTMPVTVRWALYGVAFICLYLLLPLYLAVIMTAGVAIIGETKFRGKDGD